MRLDTESKLIWVAGLALGVVAAAGASLVPDEWAPLASTACVAGVFAAVAALGAALLKRRAFVNALLIATPITVLLLTSFLFAGNVEAFARHDALVLAGAIAGAFAGAYSVKRLFHQA